MNEVNPFEEPDTTDYKAVYVAFCDEVRRRASFVAAQLMHETSRDAERARDAALKLCTDAATRKHQTEMQEEASAGSYDLATLAVNADKPSNSETAYERD